MEKPGRSLQGLRITDVVKCLGVEHLGGAQKKSFHPQAPDEDLCSCQSASEGFGVQSPGR